jgi:hypothetical protein
LFHKSEIALRKIIKAINQLVLQFFSSLFTFAVLKYKYKMKKVILVAFTIVVATTQTQAQGFLKKLKEGAVQLKDQVAATNYDPNKGMKVRDKWYEEQKADAVKTVLDAKVKKDAYGFSGLYYCRELMMTSTSQGTVKNAVGKVLLTYTHGTDETKLVIETSYDQDAANGTTAFEIIRNGYKYELQHKQSIGLKQMYVSGVHNNPTGLYIAAKHPFVDDGTVVQGKEITLKPLGRVTAVQIEPGIVLLTEGGALMYVPKGGRDPEDVKKEKMQPIVCLYTKDKEARALKLTQEEMFTMLQLREKKGNDRSDTGADGYKEMDDEIKAAAAANAGSGSDDADAKSDSKSSTKEEKIKIEFHNKTGSTDVYLVFDNNKGYQGTGRIGKGQITSYYFKAGAVVKYKTGGTLMTVSAGDKNKRVQVN